MAEFASKGVAGAALGTGIAGTALGLLNGGLNGLSNMGGTVGRNFAGDGGYGMGYGCSENHFINRYEAGQSARIAELETEVKLRDSNIYTDQKMLELYKYFDGEFKNVRDVLSSQAVMNQSTKDSFQLLQERMDCCRNELCAAISRERDERTCADNTIVTYTNATFYPKMVADVTVGTTTTAQTVYNPLPVSTCGCGCGCGH